MKLYLLSLLLALVVIFHSASAEISQLTITDPPLAPVTKGVLETGTNLTITCQYQNETQNNTLYRYWFFVSSQKPLEDSEPTVDPEQGAVWLNSTNPNMIPPPNATAGEYHYGYSVDLLGSQLNLYGLQENQSGRYWCVDFSLNYTVAVNFPVRVYQSTNYVVETIVLLVINGVLLVIFITCSIYTYIKNRAHIVRHKVPPHEEIDRANASTAHGDEGEQFVSGQPTSSSGTRT